MLEVLLYNAIYALSAPLNKIVATIAPPFVIVTIRQLVAGLILSLYYVLTRKPSKVSRQEFWLLVRMALFTMFFPPLLRTYALQSITSIKLSLLYSLTPFPTYLLSYLFINESMTRRKTGGILVGCLGLLIILMTNVPSSETFLLGRISWGEICVLLAVLSDSYGSVLTSKLVKNSSHSLVFINGSSMLFAGLLAFFFCLWTGSLWESYNLYPVIGNLAIITFTSNILSYNFYGVLLRRYSATFLSLCDFTRTAFAIIYGKMFLQESFPPSFFIASCMVFFGLYIFYKEDKRKQPFSPV